MEKIKFNFEQDNGSLMAQIGERLVCELNGKLERLIVEGLKMKGFEFSNNAELELFVKKNCRCEDNVDTKQRTYFVNNDPFFLHCYEIEYPSIAPSLDRKHSVSINYGSYSYL